MNIYMVTAIINAVSFLVCLVCVIKAYRFHKQTLLVYQMIEESRENHRLFLACALESTLRPDQIDILKNGPPITEFTNFNLKESYPDYKFFSQDRLMPPRCLEKNNNFHSYEELKKYVLELPLATHLPIVPPEPEKPKD
jgi:hypothetical protein